MDVIILAGAMNNGALRESGDSPYEAGIRIHGLTLLDYVVRPLTSVKGIERIAVVGPEECLSPASRSRVAQVVPYGDSMVENLMRGIAALDPKGQVLAVTADIPLITAEAVEDFLRRCAERQADIYYPIVARAPIEERFPGVKRTYATLREGTYTGGNIILLAPEIVEKHRGMIEHAVALRKKPLQMVRLLGLRYLWKLLLGRLSIKEIEERIEKILHFKGAAIVTPYAEIGIDVDKPSDLDLVARYIASTAQNPG